MILCIKFSMKSWYFICEFEITFIIIVILNLFPFFIHLDKGGRSRQLTWISSSAKVLHMCLLVYLFSLREKGRGEGAVVTADSASFEGGGLESEDHSDMSREGTGWPSICANELVTCKCPVRIPFVIRMMSHGYLLFK